MISIIMIALGLLLIGMLLLIPFSVFRHKNQQRSIAVTYLYGFCGLVLWSSTQLPQPTFIIVLFVAIYHMMLVYRVIAQRLVHSYLLRTTRRSTLWLIGFSLPLIGMSYVVQWVIDRKLPLGVYAAGLLCVTGLTLLSVTIARLLATRPQRAPIFYSDQDLPTVSVLIPARNEDQVLSQCLKDVIASDYPKLEIIVYDDCSSDSTSQMVKDFAQGGVRFIPGVEPGNDWLPKNAAYKALADAASGEWLLFMGVDVELSPTAIRTILTHALNHRLAMISVLPRRAHGETLENFLGTLRYWWQFAIPRDIVKHPAVLSTCWMIKSSRLKKLGGFEAACRAIIPEAILARQLYKTGNYQFVRLTQNNEIVTKKSLSEQYATAIRTLYPSMHRRIERVCLTTCFLLIVALPLPLAVVSAIKGQAVAALLYGLAFVLIGTSQTLIGLVVNQSIWPLTLIFFPYQLLQEVALVNISMYRYEFGEVLWKDRNVCYPVMHVTPHLPQKERLKK